MKYIGKYMHEMFGGYSQHHALSTAQLQHTWHMLAHALVFTVCPTRAVK